jgi:hypothetical protein
VHKILRATCSATLGLHFPWHGSFSNDCCAGLVFPPVAPLSFWLVFPSSVYAKEKAQRDYMNEMAGDDEQRTTDDYKVHQPFTLNFKS